MLKIYFNTLVPYTDRKKVINAFKDLGFTFDRLFVPGSDVSHFVFRGRLPTSDSKECTANFIFDNNAKKMFQNVKVDYVELFVDFEKRGKFL